MSESNSSKKIFDEIKSLITEQVNPKSESIDIASIGEILTIINHEDSLVHDAVAKELWAVEKAVSLIVTAFKNGGRLFYIGAGTSGRLGVLDASECPPTFGSRPEMVQGIIAGGYEALVHSQEGSEDDDQQGAKDLKSRNFNSHDVLCGLTACKRTPYVLGALTFAQSIEAKTIYVTCTPRNELRFKSDVAICPVVGPEVIMGSTRMKAGTAEKMVLNMLTTASFIQIGKVYKNMMVDLQMTSRKLQERSKRVIMDITGASYELADKVLKEAEGHVKNALLMILGNVSYDNAERALQVSEGFVRKALELIQNENSHL
jgi:N-acetylmuramic acid 6-phosphate etherase